jgi:hypothetical protein
MAPLLNEGRGVGRRGPMFRRTRLDREDASAAAGGALLGRGVIRAVNASWQEWNRASSGERPRGPPAPSGYHLSGVCQGLPAVYARKRTKRGHVAIAATVAGAARGTRSGHA